MRAFASFLKHALARRPGGFALREILVPPVRMVNLY
jgi:hypothetical protein